jgi:hypothetical protein
VCVCVCMYVCVCVCVYEGTKRIISATTLNEHEALTSTRLDNTARSMSNIDAPTSII